MRTLAMAMLAVSLIACSRPEADVTAIAADPAAVHAAHTRASDEKLTAEQLRSIAAVRRATARFHDLAVAQNAGGYTKQYPPGCAVSPDGEGAQAYHYLNESLVDDKVELLEPELLMYEPKRGGGMQLIGVDYIVPLEASATPPTLLGVPFMRNEPLEVWALHIWAWRPNPSGMFAAWNPDVSCKYAKP